MTCNEIANRQNNQVALDAVTAAVWFNLTSKVTCLFFDSVLLFVPILLSTINIIQHGFSSSEQPSAIAAFYGICASILHSTFIEFLSSKTRESVSWYFDYFERYVLGIKWSSFVLGNKPSPMLIESLCTSYRKSIFFRSEFANWYGNEISDVDIRAAQLLCQRATCSRYARGHFLISFSFSAWLVVGLFLILQRCVEVQLSLAQLVLMILVPSAPLIVVILQKLAAWRSAELLWIKLLAEISRYIDLWERRAVGDAELDVAIFEIQNRIFDLRSKFGVPVISLLQGSILFDRSLRRLDFPLFVGQ